MITVDAHYDLGPILYNRHMLGEKNIIKNHLLKEWLDNDVRLIVAAIFLENHFVGELSLRQALNQITLIKEEIASCDEVMLVIDSHSLDQVLNEKKIGIIMSLEGLEPIGHDLLLIDTFYDLGVRAAGLTWSRQNLVADGSRFEGENTDHGLTHFGKSVVKKLRDKGILVDISHLNDAGVSEMNGRFYASHSNSRSVNPITRNLSDEQLIKLKNAQGIVGINGIKPIVGGGISELCDHIDYIKSLIGIEYICLGLDKCNELEQTGLRYGNQDEVAIDVVPTYYDLKLVVEALKNRNYSEKEIEAILHGNFIRFIKEWFDGCNN